MGRFFNLIFTGIVVIIAGNRAFSGYPWPLSPMNEQHRISATFGECREDRDHFHDGVDIPLAQGGSVLASKSGTVISYSSEGTNAYIRVGQFAYVHVTPDPALDVGDYVQQGDIVGITNNQNHIHFKDGGGGSGYSIKNALRDGALTPFDDPYKPNPSEISLYPDGSETPFPSNVVSGHVDIVAHASDVTDLESPIDMNNGVYRIGYAVFSDDTSEILQGPYIPYTFLDYPPSSAIRRVYFRGSSTSEYYYIITNTFQSDTYWNSSALEPGNYVIGVFSYDTKLNADTSYYQVTVSSEDLAPPSQPELKYVIVRNDTLFISWNPVMDNDLAGYRLYFSFDGENWTMHSDEDAIPAGVDQYYIPGFTVGHDIYFYITAVDNAPLPNESLPSDSYGVNQGGSLPACLIVDGFDRIDDSWTLPYHAMAVIHGQALSANGVNFATCSNEAVTDNLLDLSGFEAVFWILGDEGVADYTLTSEEQGRIKNYLESGGKLFISGSEIGYDLYANYEDGDRDFYTNYLKAVYIADDANDYTVEGEPGTYFEGLSFAYGESPYEENYPDVIAPTGGSEVICRYDAQKTAALGYRGTFGESTLEGGLIYFAFPFETISGEEDRIAVIHASLRYFDLVEGLYANSDIPEQFRIISAFPNPFNSMLTIGGVCKPFESLEFRIVDLTGREVWKRKYFPSNRILQIQWDGKDLWGNPAPSGFYMAIVNQGSSMDSRRITLLK